MTLIWMAPVSYDWFGRCLYQRSSCAAQDGVREIAGPARHLLKSSSSGFRRIRKSSAPWRANVVAVELVGATRRDVPEAAVDVATSKCAARLGVALLETESALHAAGESAPGLGRESG